MTQTFLKIQHEKSENMLCSEMYTSFYNTIMSLLEAPYLIEVLPSVA